MADPADTIPAEIREHLRNVTRTSGLPDSESSYQSIVSSWLEKNRVFESQIKALGMTETEEITVEEPRGAIMLTASGSIMAFGTAADGIRWAEYASIQLRRNVPELAIINRTRLVRNARRGDFLEFESGPIRRTSRIFRIAVCPQDVPMEEQEKRIREGTMFLAHAFAKVNRTLDLPIALPSKFTMKGMVDAISDRHDITKKAVRAVVDDFLLVVKSGMLSGKRVPLGQIGKLYLRVKPAQKARIVRNPKTGEEVTVEGRPETAVPKMSFSKYMRDQAATAPLDTGRQDM